MKDTTHINVPIIIFVISENILIHFVVGTYSMCPIDIFTSTLFLDYK